MLTSLVLSLLLQQVAGPADTGVIEGVLRASTGEPAAGVRVVAKAPELPGDKPGTGPLTSLTQTDSEGRFRLEDVPAGRYLISAGNLALPTYYPGTIEVEGGTVVTVASGATISGLNFTLDERSVGRAATRSTMYFSTGVVRLSLSVSIRVEGGGKLPLVSDGHYPVLRLRRAAWPPIEVWFDSNTIDLPIPVSMDEYDVSVDDLPPGYSVKSLTQGTTDLLKETLKVSRPAQPAQTNTPGQNFIFLGSSANAGAPLAITLSHTPQPIPPGIRVTGKSIGPADEIYISGKPGTLYSDGSFEFFGVSPGLHSITRIRGNTVAAATVLVRDRDVEVPSLESVQILPSDVFSREPGPPDPNLAAPTGLLTIHGRVLDDASNEELHQGAVRVAGYPQNFRLTYAIVAPEGFRIPSLLPGSYDIEVVVPGYESTTRTVTVGGEDVSLEIKVLRSRE